MSIKKQYLKSKPVCKVTVSLPKENFVNARQIQIIGEFNQWSMECEPMKPQKNGLFTQTLELDAGKEYQYRLLIDGTQWMNDPEAEKLVPNEFASSNCAFAT